MYKPVQKYNTTPDYRHNTTRCDRLPAARNAYNYRLLLLLQPPDIAAVVILQFVHTFICFNYVLQNPIRHILINSRLVLNKDDEPVVQDESQIVN